MAQQIWAFLNEYETKIILETTARLRHPAVEGIDELINEKFGALKSLPQEEFHRYKRMIGHMIRQVMENLGYELDAQNIKIRRPTDDSFFTSGSRYKKRQSNP